MEEVISPTALSVHSYLTFISDTLNEQMEARKEWNDIDWSAFYSFAEKQAILGIVYEGIVRYGGALKGIVPRVVLFQWISVAEQIQKQNSLLNRRSVEVTKLFGDAGFRTCILKGQGNALMYPNPGSRTAGDVDIWIDGTREDINAFVRKECPDAFEQDHHIAFPIYKDVEIEVHYKPCTLLSPQKEKKFLAWCGKQKKILMSNGVDMPEGGTIFVPTPEFNAVFQLAHIMIHFFIEGIGLRHFVDYYYVLKANTDKSYVVDLFKEFGLLRFARGVMWVEKECLGLGEHYLLVEPDEKCGRAILSEMLEGGNFGHHDKRYRCRENGYLARGLTDIYRLVKLASVFPSESLWKLYRKGINQKWKLKGRLIKTINKS